MVDIGFLGLGQMGTAMAERLILPDQRLHIYDPLPGNMAPLVARGAIAHPSAESVADAAPIIFACLPNPAVSLQVAQQMAAGSRLTHYVELSTIGRPAIEKISDILGACDIATIDAPVSGGPDAAREGRLSIMIAGATQAVEMVRPYLAQMAGFIFDVGPNPGMAQVMKLVNNLIAASNLAATMESLLIGARAGLEGAVMLDVINRSSGRNSATDSLIPRQIMTEYYNFGATIATMTKDVDLALTEASGLPISVMATVADQWHNCLKLFGPDADLTRFATLREQDFGVRLTAQTAPAE